MPFIWLRVYEQCLVIYGFWDEDFGDLTEKAVLLADEGGKIRAVLLAQILREYLHGRDRRPSRLEFGHRDFVAARAIPRHRVLRWSTTRSLFAKT